MEDILTKLPQSVLDYTDPNGYNITNQKFDPFSDMVLADSYATMNPGEFLIAYDDNIQDIITHNVQNVAIRYNPNTFMVDAEAVVAMIASANIRCLHVATTYGMILESPSHIDFVRGPIIMSSYYTDFINDNAVILHNPPYGMPVVNDLIKLGTCEEVGPYLGDVTATYIGYSSYYNLLQVEHFVCNQKNTNLQLYSRMAAFDQLIKNSTPP